MEEARENSYINIAEVDEIVKRVKELAGDWPVEWKEKDLSKIGVVSAYLSQVKLIRDALRREGEGLKKVTVETIYNVQGKEFRALFISTVRTSLTFPQFHKRNDQRFYWEFFSDPKLLNTAVTRAMSLVAVVGDAVSLCTVGECRSNWRDFIRRCDQDGSLSGTSYTAIKEAIATPLSKISLNPEAAVFVPSSDGGLKPLVCDRSPGAEDTETIELGDESSAEHSLVSPMTVSGSKKDEEEHKTDGSLEQYSQGDSFPHQEDEDDSELSYLTPFEDFRREGCEDETVLPSSFDKVIEALVATKKETQARELQRSLNNEEYPSLRNAESINRKGCKVTNDFDKGSKHNNRSSRENSSLSGLSSDDYQFSFDAKGRVQARLVNFGYHQTHSNRHNRQTGQVKEDEYLHSEVLLKFIREKPKTYRASTLHLDSEAFNMAFATVPDTQTPDIRIKGRVKRVFDMDQVVISIAENQSNSIDAAPRYQGEIVGVLHHIISPHERQFVCKVNFHNPNLMLPINKSMSKIVILSADGVEGVPLYKELREGNGKKVKVCEMDREEFLSGKYLFLVQFLQWRSDYIYPLGIIIRKLPKRYTWKASMEILLAEHGIRKSFSDDCKREVRTKFPSSWSIPAHERNNREVVKGAFTIDPENSKDLDDALSLEVLSSSAYRVGIHIADVSYFVEAGSYLDKEALFRCISYYPGNEYQNVPMLPPDLSEKHCSLLPGRDRLCLSVFLDMSEDGRCLGEPQIKRTIVTSSCQLTYSDAQKVIDAQRSSRKQFPKSVESDIQALSVLAQRRRKLRLREACFDHWSDSDEPECYEAHELVEEMMILANEKIGHLLLASIPEMAPLCTQLPPKDYKLKDWLSRYGHFIKCSLFLRGKQHLEKMTEENQMREITEFKVKDSVWSEICSAVESDDKAKLQQLIFTERKYPQLAVANLQFQRIQQKSCYVCERGHPRENSLHFSLGEHGYTHFTSPIRRYIDIQVHRLVLGLISNDHGAERYRKDYVAKVCRRSTFAQRNSKKFDRASSKVHLAAKLKEVSRETKAVIAMIEDKSIKLEITSQEYDRLSKKEREIKFSDLNLYDFMPYISEVVFVWKLRLYIAPKGNESLEDYIENLEIERNEVVSLLNEGLAATKEVLSLEMENWMKLLEAVQNNDYAEAKMLITKTEADHQRALRKRFPSRTNEKSDSNMEHFHERRLSLATFDVVNVQLSAHMTHGMLHPQIQLFKINSKVHICIEHRKYPRECFATTVKYRASRASYSCLESYITAWEPVLAMESATEAVDESDEFTIHDLHVKWWAGTSENPVGSFSLDNEYCTTRQIEFFPGDFVCIHVREDFNKDCPSSTSRRNISQIDTNLEELCDPTAAGTSSLEGNSPEETHEVSSNVWVGHCVVRRAELSKENTLLIEMNFHQSASKFPEELLSGGQPSTLTVIHRSLPNRRMFAALKELRNASKLSHAICLGKEPGQGWFEPQPPLDTSIVRDYPQCGFKPLNPYQQAAVKGALEKPFTLIQGPPGTGKTVTGVHIAFGFAKRNKQNLHTFDLESQDEPKAPPQVIYCGPSNKAVDVVAEYMIKVPGLNIIRVYSDRKEQAEFPIPNKRQTLKQSTDDGTGIPEKLKNVSLHHIIRKYPCPYADELEMYENKFEYDRKESKRTSKKEVIAYCQLIGKAEVWALQSSGAQVILCTCSVAGSRRMVTTCDNVQQCIIDECGMCMELESLVPITFSKAKQVVLIGDHKQLQPVVKDQQALTLGLNVSMFERLSDRAQMLEIQYRMQKEICSFPSEYFYESKLKTDKSVPTNDPSLRSFWPNPNVPLAFCHVEGDEESTAIKTTHSSEQSKSNQKEVRKVVHVARSLVFKNGVSPSDVVILSPYREQRERISKALEGNIKSKEIPVTTIIKSQGSEWDYVILSLVRSLNKDDLEPDPSMHWLREHLGFLTDEHLMNVGLTRARKGLCIIGNKKLLVLHPMWEKLLEFYKQRECVVNESAWPVS